MKIETIDGKHFYVNSKGEKVPSVTTILSVINKPDLLKWANALGLKHIGYEEYMNSRAEIGTDFHKMAEDYMSGRPVEGVHFKESIEMFNRFMIWAKNHYYKVYRSEFSLVGKRFGGTIDAIADVDGAFSIVDYKTAKEVYIDFFIQLAGYGLLLKEIFPETYKHIKAFGVLTMRNSQTYKFLSKKTMEEYFMPVFNDALNLYTSYDIIKNRTYW